MRMTLVSGWCPDNSKTRSSAHVREPFCKVLWRSGCAVPSKTAPCGILGALQFLEKTVEHLLCAGCGAAGRGCGAHLGAPPQECHLSGQFLQRVNEGPPWMVEEAAPRLAPMAMGAAPLAGAVEQGLPS